MDILQFIGSIGGIAGVLAFIIFMMYRQDRKESSEQLREDRKFMEDRLSKIIDDYNKTATANTEVLFELVTWLKAKNGHR